MKFLIALLLFPCLVLAAPSSQRELTGDHIRNNSAILGLPTSSDTLMGRQTTDTIKNKTINGPDNTITNISNGSIASTAAIDFAKLATLTNGNILVGSGSNVATSVTPSGDVSLSNAGVFTYNNLVPIAKGGLNNSVLATAGGMLYSDGTKFVNMGAGTAGQVPVSAAGSPPVWTTLAKPTVQQFTATGTTAGYWFTVSSANATVGATYTNNGNTYTVLTTIASGSKLYVSGASAPLATGTLTKASGTGDATIAYAGNSVFLAQGTLAVYTPTTGTKLVKLTVIGGGSSAGGCGATSTSQCDETGGAGGAGTVIKWISDFTGPIYYGVGTAGAAVSAGANTGNLGGLSVVISPTLGVFFAANGSVSGGSSAAAAPSQVTGGAGGIATGGDLNIAGQGGTSGFCINATGATAAVIPGVGGSSAVWGLGGSAGGFGTLSGTGYGSGGGGCALSASQSAAAGGAGPTGVVVFEEFTQ